MIHNHKLQALRLALARSREVRLYVNPQLDPFDCVVPEHLKLRTDVVLVFGNDLPVPILDLSMNLMKVSGTLSFSGRPFTVHLPWECVLGMAWDAGCYDWGMPKSPEHRERVKTLTKGLIQRDRGILDALAESERKNAKVFSLVDYRRSRGL